MPGSLVGDIVVDPRETMDTPRSAPSDLRAAVRVSVASVVWTIATGAAAIAVGIADGILVLVVFGVTGSLDAVGSAALALHFRHALKHEVISESRERIALRIVSGGLIFIGVVTVIESTRRLVAEVPGHGSPVGTGIAVSSILVLMVLSVTKRRIAARLSSRALRADGWLSATGAGLGAITVAGSLAGDTYVWLDPVAALVIAIVASAVGVAALRREEKELR